MKPGKGKPRLWSNAAQIGLNRFGEERELRPISLAKVVFMAEVDDPAEAAERIITMRVVRAGRDAWEQIGKADSFDSWKAIGAALSIGKAHALRLSGAERAWGRRYAIQFGRWLREFGFDRMPKSTRSVAIELHEHCAEIEAWRATLPAKLRKRLIHPLSNVRRWRASTTHTNGKHPMDRLSDARTAWRKFVACAGLLPPEQAAIVWRAAAIEIEAQQTPAYTRIWRVGTDPRFRNSGGYAYDRSIGAAV